MKEYDVIVVGGGSGGHLVDVAYRHDMDVCYIEMDKLGGTCLNYGCIPTKMLTYPADICRAIKKAVDVGVHAEVQEVDFQSIMERMRESVSESEKQNRKNVSTAEIDFYGEKASFIDKYTLEVDNQEVVGDKIFLATGARPAKPPIKGIDQVDVHTNETILEIEEKPESIIMIGGGYITSEFAHFFHEMGSEVTIIQRNKHLVPDMDITIKQTLTNQYIDRMNVHTETEATEITMEDGKKKIACSTPDGTRSFVGEEVLVATGRKSNADLLNLENTDIETDENGYIKVNSKMETTQEDVWAIGDATGKHMFKHTANREARTAGENAFHQADIKMKYHANPRGVYSSPQIASVGLTETEATEKHSDILVGTANYSEVAKGEAMKEKTGLTKAIIKEETNKILGYHIIGPHAPILIQEVINIMESRQTAGAIFNGMHIHPALPEITQKPFTNLHPSKQKTP